MKRSISFTKLKQKQRQRDKLLTMLYLVFFEIDSSFSYQSKSEQVKANNVQYTIDAYCTQKPAVYGSNIQQGPPHIHSSGGGPFTDSVFSFHSVVLKSSFSSVRVFVRLLKMNYIIWHLLPAFRCLQTERLCPVAYAIHNTVLSNPLFVYNLILCMQICILYLFCCMRASPLDAVFKVGIHREKKKTDQVESRDLQYLLSSIRYVCVCHFQFLFRFGMKSLALVPFCVVHV